MAMSAYKDRCIWVLTPKGLDVFVALFPLTYPPFSLLSPKLTHQTLLPALLSLSLSRFIQSNNIHAPSLVALCASSPFATSKPILYLPRKHLDDSLDFGNRPMIEDGKLWPLLPAPSLSPESSSRPPVPDQSFVASPVSPLPLPSPHRAKSVSRLLSPSPVIFEALEPSPSLRRNTPRPRSSSRSRSDLGWEEETARRPRSRSGSRTSSEHTGWGLNTSLLLE